MIHAVIWCSNCDHQYRNAPLTFATFPEHHYNPQKVAYIDLPLVPCPECGAMEWQMLLRAPDERRAPAVLCSVMKPQVMA